MSVNEGLQRLRAIRRGPRAAATKSINEINGILSTTLSSESSTKLNALKLKLEWKQRTLNELDAKILNEVKIEDIEKEIEESEVIVTNITEAKEKIECAIRANTNTSTQVNVEAGNSSGISGPVNVTSTRLPKLQLTHFKGDVTKWSSSGTVITLLYIRIKRYPK
jgi:hypothetical protein